MKGRLIELIKRLSKCVFVCVCLFQYVAIAVDTGTTCASNGEGCEAPSHSCDETKLSHTYHELMVIFSLLTAK